MPLRIAVTLLIAAACGWTFATLRLPLPWMLGPLIGVAALRVLGVDLAVIPGARQAGQWIIGTALGLYFTPVVVAQVARVWYLLLAGAAFAVAIGYLSALVLSRLARIDRTTALFASVPAGAADMAVLGEQFGARVDLVAAAHSLRLLIVVVGVPFGYALLGIHGVDAYVQGANKFALPGFALLMALTFVGGAVLQRFRIPNAFVLGPLAVAVPLTAAQIDLSAIPGPLSAAAQLLLGSALGVRFGPSFLHGAARFVGGVVVSIALAVALALGFALILASLSRLPLASLALGLMPGGIAEMCITAKVLQLGVPLVTGFHVTRVVVLLLGTGPLFRVLRQIRRSRASA